MSEPIFHDDQWQACPPGALARIARLQQAEDRRSALRRTSLGAAASVMVATGLVVGAGLASGSGTVRMRCPECHQRFTEFHDHQTKVRSMTDVRKVEGMKQHFKKCGGCRKQFQKKYPDCPVSKCGPPKSCTPPRDLTASPASYQPASLPSA